LGGGGVLFTEPLITHGQQWNQVSHIYVIIPCFIIVTQSQQQKNMTIHHIYMTGR